MDVPTKNSRETTRNYRKQTKVQKIQSIYTKEKIGNMGY